MIDRRLGTRLGTEIISAAAIGPRPSAASVPSERSTRRSLAPPRGLGRACLPPEALAVSDNPYRTRDHRVGVEQVARHRYAADAVLRGRKDRSLSPGPHGRTRMIVLPLRRSVGLRAATASSRVATLPMFVRSRPSRTRRTISPNWARSDSTTKSIARPSVGRASGARRRSPVFLRPG